MTRPAPWQVNPVHLDDELRIQQIMNRREEETGEQQFKAPTIRRAIRALWRLEVADGMVHPRSAHERDVENAFLRGELG